jgi:hypothetical protein
MKEGEKKEENHKLQAESSPKGQATGGEQEVIGCEQDQPETGNLKPETELQPQSSDLSAETSAKADLNPETKIMEVHKHPHHVMHKKKWPEYLLEFLMLFLAVFLGFLAENFREHQVEHQREKQYAATLYEDIKSDTAALRAAISVNIFVTSRIDTFRSMVQTQPLNSLPTGTWYYYGRFGTRYFHIAFQDATIEQLKSSGGLRYFKKQNVVTSIARYDQARRDLQTLLKFQDPIYNDLIKARNLLFNAFYLDEIMDFDSSRVDIGEFKSSNFPLLSENKQDFIQYANLCQLRSYNNKYLMRRQQTTLETAEKLLTEIKKEYYLDE